MRNTVTHGRSGQAGGRCRAAVLPRLLSVFALLGLLAACAGGGDGMSRTAMQDGIGGTGAPLQAPAETHMAGQDGIGGTGLYGTITGFGSVHVNGHRVTYDSSLPVRMDDVDGSVADLKLGQVVEIVADARGDGPDLAARWLVIHHAMTGPITAIDHAAGRMTVAGRAVEVSPGDDASRAAFHALTVGDKVRVSGLLRPDAAVSDAASGDVLVASRVDQMPLTTPDRLPTLPIAPDFRGEADSVSVEGYVRTTDEGQRVGGLPMAGPATDTGLESGVRVIVGGRLTQTGGVAIETITPVGTIVTLLSASPREARGGDIKRPDRLVTPDRLIRPERPDFPAMFTRPERPERPARERPTGVPMI